MIMFRRAQSLNEYALIIAAVALAAVTMQTYVKRGIQGVIKQTADVLTAGGTQAGLTNLMPQAKVTLPDGDVPQYKYPQNHNAGTNWHPAAGKYLERNGGFIAAEKTGNTISYYHRTTDPVTGELTNGTLIAKEDLTTRDYTEFMPSGSFEEGFAKSAAVISADGKSGIVDPAIEYFYNDNGNTNPKKKEIVSVTVKKGSQILGTYGKYQMVNLTAPAELKLQQKGSQEAGLYSYTQITPIRVKKGSAESPVKTEVEEFRQNPATLPEKNYHNFISTNYLNYPGEPYPAYPPLENDPTPNNSNPQYPDKDGTVKTKIKGNTVYYYLKKDGNETLIGAENALTRDFTLFNEDGFADNGGIIDRDGNRYTDLGFEYNKDPKTREVISVTVKQNGQTVGTYGKYQAVKVRQTPLQNNPLAILTDVTAEGAVTARTKTILDTNKDITTVKGKWSTTYKLETAGSFGKLKNERPPEPPGGANQAPKTSGTIN